jgi:chemotaxis protein methyltransferase CheR
MNATVTTERDYPLSDGEFAEIRDLVRSHTGISLAASKRELVYSRLVRRLRRLKLSSFRDYIGLLEQGEPAELEEFTNAITTNLTSFFRESHHFDYLKSTVFPELEKRNASTRRIRIWSAACSTGEEPYSIAMCLHEAMSRFRGWDVKILATDLDSNVVSHAREGRYAPERVEKMPVAQRNKYFTDTTDGAYQISNDLKSLVTFNQMNLMHPWRFKGPFDVIFCRNVVIYFDKPTQRDLFGRMAGVQRVGDYLFIGHSENLFKVCESYALIGKTMYRKSQ